MSLVTFCHNLFTELYGDNFVINNDGIVFKKDDCEFQIEIKDTLVRNINLWKVIIINEFLSILRKQGNPNKYKIILNDISVNIGKFNIYINLPDCIVITNNGKSMYNYFNTHIRTRLNDIEFKCCKYRFESIIPGYITYSCENTRHIITYSNGEISVPFIDGSYTNDIKNVLTIIHKIAIKYICSVNIRSTILNIFDILIGDCAITFSICYFSINLKTDTKWIIKTSNISVDNTNAIDEMLYLINTNSYFKDYEYQNKVAIMLQ